MSHRTETKGTRPDWHYIPPPPAWRSDAGGPMGSAVLSDLDGDLGVSLWLALRAVWTWAEATPQRRERLKKKPGVESGARRVAACAAAPELREALDVFGALGSTPSELPEEAVSRACRMVSDWADQHWLHETALHFAEAAARANPQDPEQANLAGLACRRTGHGDRAGVWYSRAFRLAIRHRNRREAIWAQLGYGALMKDLGRLGTARSWFRRAARRALRTGRRREAAEAFHDLFALSAEAGRLRDAGRYAVKALRLYPLYHPRLPYLAHDFAYLLVRRGMYAPAHSLLEAFVQVIPARDLLPGLSTLAWAAAGRGLTQRFDAVEQQTRQLVQVEAPTASPTYRYLAEGARLLGRWEDADRLARQAVEAAEVSTDVSEQHYTASLLESIIQRTPIPAPRKSAGAGTMAAIRLFSARLRRWKPRAISIETDGADLLHRVEPARRPA